MPLLAYCLGSRVWQLRWVELRLEIQLARHFRDEALGSTETTWSVHGLASSHSWNRNLCGGPFSWHDVFRQSYYQSHCVGAVLINHLMPVIFFIWPEKINMKLSCFVLNQVISCPFLNFSPVFNSENYDLLRWELGMRCEDQCRNQGFDQASGVSFCSLLPNKPNSFDLALSE